MIYKHTLALVTFVEATDETEVVDTRLVIEEEHESSKARNVHIVIFDVLNCCTVVLG